MKRSLILGVIILIAFASSASAANSQPSNLYWSVDWGKVMGAKTGVTTWYAVANPAVNITVANHLRGYSTSDARNITPKGVSSRYSASYQMSDAIGFTIGINGTGESAGTFWYEGNCRPGPRVSFNFRSRMVVVQNTTGRFLWVYDPANPDSGFKLRPGSAFSRSMYSFPNGLVFQTSPSMDGTYTCMTARWTLD